VNELENHPAQRRGAIRSDAIQIRFDFDGIAIRYQIMPGFESASIQF
jgi:hypothetical protein